MRTERIGAAGYSPNFKAIVNIKASEALLDKNAIKELKEIGEKIGDKNTTINMYAGYVKENPYVYKFSQKTEHCVNEPFVSEKITFETDENILHPTKKPLDYGKELLDRIKTFICRNTIMK